MSYKEDIRDEMIGLLKSKQWDLESHLQILDRGMIPDIQKISSIEELEAIKNKPLYKEWKNTKNAIEDLQKAIECLSGSRDRDFFVRYIDSISI